MAIKNIIDKTNGKKTESAGLLMIAFQILMLYKPDLIDPTTEKAINIAISSGAFATIAHRIWRNRKKVFDYINNIFKFKNK